MVVLGVIYLLIWIYASYGYRLMDKTVKPEIIRKATYILLIAPITYIVAILIAFINPAITIILYIIIPIAYVIPSPIDEVVDYIFEEDLKS